MKTRNTELLIKAIDDYNVYTKKQRQLLKILINVAIQDMIKITVVDLQNISRIAKSTIYISINRFKQDGIITILDDSTFKLNGSTLDSIINSYLKKEEIKKANLK